VTIRHEPTYSVADTFAKRFALGTRNLAVGRRRALLDEPEYKCTFSLQVYYRIRGFTRFDLVVNPGIRFFHTGAQWDRWFPVEHFPNQSVVTVTAIYAFWRIEVVAAFQLDPGDVLYNVDQLIDGHLLRAAEIDWKIYRSAVHDVLNPLDAVIDVHETPRLLSAPPNLYGMIAGKFRFNDLAAYRGGRLFTASVIGTQWSIHIVKSGDPGYQTEVFGKMPAHPFTEKLLSAIAVSGIAGYASSSLSPVTAGSVCFLESCNGWIRLPIMIINTHGRCVENKRSTRASRAA
jgi:hypothetical protein